MRAIAPELRGRVEAWIARDPDPATRAELEAMLAEGDEAALAERFAGRLAFGTAGLRGPMAAGPTRMNRALVREAAAGIARHLAGGAAGAPGRGVVVAHDARHRSRVFAADCAEVIAAHGIPVTLAPEPLPTPIGVFAIRHLGCVAGIVLTASHNPAADNGLKLYLGDGAQIVPPADGLIAAAIEAVAADGVVIPPGAPPAPVAPLSRGGGRRLPGPHAVAGAAPRRPDPDRHDGHARGRRGDAGRPAGRRRPRRGAPGRRAGDARPGLPHGALPQPGGAGRHRPAGAGDAGRGGRSRPGARPRRRPRRGDGAGCPAGRPAS